MEAQITTRMNPLVLRDYLVEAYDLDPALQLKRLTAEEKGRIKVSLRMVYGGPSHLGVEHDLDARELAQAVLPELLEIHEVPPHTEVLSVTLLSGPWLEVSARWTPVNTLNPTAKPKP
ncbi:MAG: hypothetical protein ACI8UO_003746 [Verrucomicrobiales bacterium]|jgi:hypothetical protein